MASHEQTSNGSSTRRRDIWISVVAVILAWMALDDITTDRDENFVLEWAMVAASVAWFAWLALRRTLLVRRAH